MTDTLKPIHNCPTCGQRVTVYSGGEGTNSYEPYCEKELDKLTQTLATERDAFGKRETELMRANRIYREALEKIKDLSAYRTEKNFRDIFSFSKEALQGDSPDGK